MYWDNDNVYLGRFYLGQEVTYHVHTVSAVGLPVAPDAAPLAAVYEADGDSPERGLKVPSRDFPLTTGLFEGRLQLDEKYAVGQYTILVTWLASGAKRARMYRFEIMPGGDGSGQITSMINFIRPNANFIINARSSGRIYKGRNPRVV